MKINLANEVKIQEAIKEAEGKATARTVDVQDIVRVLNEIYVPKSKLNGTKVYYDGAEHFPNAYKHRPESTHWTAENINGRWYITDIYRDTCPNRSSRQGWIEYSQDAKEWILDDASMIR